eukprot:11623788-Alexandrium_andersonii.AAC.1
MSGATHAVIHDNVRLRVQAGSCRYRSRLSASGSRVLFGARLATCSLRGSLLSPLGWPPPTTWLTSLTCSASSL